MPNETSLPDGVAEGASVTTELGVVVIGGTAAKGATDAVWILNYEAASGKVKLRALPSLPEPLANAAAAYWQGKIYVAGGESAGRISNVFLVFDLAANAADSDAKKSEWNKLPSWSGAARFGAVMSVLKTRGGERLFLFGGRGPSDGNVKEADYRADGFSYDFGMCTWSVAAAMPHRALQAAGFRADESRFVVMGGSDGHDLANMAKLGERYRLPDHVMLYDAIADAWREIGKMPIGAGGAAVVEMGNQWLVAGGEPSPALRTNRTYIVNFTGSNFSKQ